MRLHVNKRNVQLNEKKTRIVELGIIFLLLLIHYLSVNRPLLSSFLTRYPSSTPSTGKSRSNL